MKNSLQEQLLKANLANKKQAQKAKKQQHQARKGNKSAQPDHAAAEVVKQERAEKLARDRALNQKKQEEAKQKAITAQIRQLIESNRLSRDQGEQPYNFVDESKVRKIYLTEQMHKQLSGGYLSIVKWGESYEVVPRKVADKISERDELIVIPLNVSDDTSVEDDAYADYEIPDDLMW